MEENEEAVYLICSANASNYYASYSENRRFPGPKSFIVHFPGDGGTGDTESIPGNRQITLFRVKRVKILSQLHYQQPLWPTLLHLQPSFVLHSPQLRLSELDLLLYFPLLETAQLQQSLQCSTFTRRLIHESVLTPLSRMSPLAAVAA